MPESLPPFLIFYVVALLALPARGILRTVLMLSAPVLGAWCVWQTPEGSYGVLQVLQFELTLHRVDRLATLFGYLFNLAAFIAFVYALHVRDRVQQTASILYAGSALGAVYAGDLITLFVFWEMLALTSVFLVWARRTDRAYRSGMRYLIIQVLSGLLLLGGVIAYAADGNSLSFDYIGLEGFASWLILLAFGIKCAFPFMHNWLTDAYPESTPTGTVFLSAFTTKVAVYALARAFPGTELLVYVGATMATFPIFFAVIENDLRRVLAYSLINQVGFMVVGIGIGTALAINGAVSHAFNDVIFKGLLFMSMGAVLYRTGKINGSELGGLYKTMPKTTVLCIVGAASISAFPLFSGFVSKSMVMSAALANDFHIVWLLLLFASAGVFHHAGIKIPYFAFFAHDSGIRTQEAPTNMLVAMSLAAALCITIGVFPDFLYRLLPYDTGYNPYDATHVLAQTQLLFFSALAFVWLNLRGMYPPELPSTNLDADWLYRRLAPSVIGHTASMVARWDAGMRSSGRLVLVRAAQLVNRHHSPGGFLARTWSTGSAVFWVVAILAVYLLLFAVGDGMALR
ncbi:Na(+)/H(+) antiporter subunit D [Chromatocurvus halotolerans]|uniref:Multisubunit sodium/proton antiporter MrpD subunit n=1 Tax=Chromatocurvus halotolerans TaxID=1132028 RepID=A0A4R2KPE4_9GAMM|nr:Na(+)/H(+) antiporter subunit D [Chromatocurvus halotolerans]TCO72726.1 multisubunit sodium/proton antiporter MrpD subunit [Chromatocurvus halotolerans]